MSGVKRTTEGEETSTKKQDLGYEKGYAAIKPEFIIATEPVSAVYNDDEAETGDRNKDDRDNNNSKGKKKKQRGQNKKRELRQVRETVRLCSTLLDPDNIRECKHGENCSNTHDVEEYLAAKGEDLEGVCPVYQAIGYCPAGLKCRWLGSHYDQETKKLVKDLAKIEQAAIDNHEVNKISVDARGLLQRKKYNHEKAESMIKWLDSQVNNDDNKEHLEKVKENQASYVEAPLKKAEKKKLNFKGAKIVSPLTTVGNLPYRRLMKTLGADVTYGEMALSLPLIQGYNSEWALPKAHSSEYPGFGVQIAGSKHWATTKVAELIANETSSVSELNLNCGCPIDLLYRQGQGSALMEQPSRLARILKGMNYCSGDIPVTVKMRTGTKDGKNIAIPLIKRLLNEGDIASITLHGRSRQQRYTKEADWNYIAEAAKVVKEFNENQEEDKEATDKQKVQFVGNGDVFTWEDWYKATETEGIDSVMVARGALIKPWIFEEVEAKQYLDKSASERLEIYKKYADFAIQHWGPDEYGVGLARRFMCEFISFTHRYIPVGILERLPPKMNERPPKWKGRNELETLLGSTDYKDWIKITEMFLGKAGDNFNFTPKHKSNSYN
ncbi:tRNA-dihydrouridine(47) synthase [NAD(P)(+)] [[Candida] jaroonii]|uniref:tRNA-dihydrouridine(47) synthase [NAD(P)(+)] n=1 Tax=[Candida] jaroonii TaxID=467808 RepID=A0ACA9YDR9_9ASCO|nr:tRNA-dihydrouridine(47) synthase [NAD(P)(+)] [[Candida] jaroonii]